MLDSGHRSSKTRRTQLALDVTAVHDGRLRPAQQAAQHRQAFVIGPDLQRPHTLGVIDGRLIALFSHRAHVSVPIAAFDGKVGNQMMQVGFMDHNHAGMFQGRFITKIVKRVVADLIERHIEAGGIVFGWARSENFHRRQPAEILQQCD